MLIKELIVKSFRNYQNLSIEFSPEMNFILGENGTGKTNILEAIYILSNIRSFRNIPDSEIIKWDEKSYYCSLKIDNDEYEKFEVGCEKTNDRIRKKFKIDGKEIKNTSRYYGKLLTVIFSPMDINIINGPPEIRRRYFDSVISKIDISYFELLGEFKKILSSRNSLLKLLKNGESNNYNQLDVWDTMFSDRAAEIIRKRIAFINTFIDCFRSSYEGISEKGEVPEIEYINTSEANDPIQISNRLRELRKRDVIVGSTGIGPQRDDYQFVSNTGIRFANYASRGQMRTAAISLKIGECDIIENHKGKQSIILVDDIFSELDEKRKTGMIKVLSRGNQIILTMVNTGTIKFYQADDRKQFMVEPAGTVREMAV